MPREHEDWVRQLYLTHAPDLYRAARYRLQDPELAYDLTQEVFLTLLDKQAQVKHHPNPAGWLWKTLQYKLGHAFSRQAVRAKYEAGQADPDWLPAPLPATGGTLDEILPRQLPERDRAEIVFSGRSNVGKSSLINKLCNRKSLARVSSTPGKTATINFYTVGGVYLVDLPGYGYAKVAQGERQRWDKLINSYFERGRRCALLVQLLDSRHAPSADDEMMLEYLAHHEVPFIAALTKADKLKKSQYAETAARFAEICAPYGCRGVVLTSADNGYGIPELRDVLDQFLAEG